MKAGTLSIFKAVRYPNLLIMAATQAFCTWCLAPGIGAGLLLTEGFIFTLLSTLLVGAGGYIFNDIKDTETDALNKPGRVIITTENRRGYTILYVVLTALGIACGIVASIYTGITALVMAALLAVYSILLKRQILTGNIAVAVMSATTLLILHFALPAVSMRYLWIYAAFAFIVTMVREIVKDIEDLDGDRETGCRTLPVVYGTETAKRTALAFTIVLIIGTILFALKCLLSIRVLAFAYLIAIVVIPAFGLFFYIRAARQKKYFAKASLYCKLLMLAGIVSMYFIY